jgi:hypothetical protein
MTNLRLRVLPRYPARITGTGGIMVEREDVDLIVSPDFGQLAVVEAVPDEDETFFQAWTRDVDTYSIIPFSAVVDAAASIIGGDIQPLSPALTSIAGLTTSANKMIYSTASNTYAVADLSPYARSLLDDATAGDALTTLGVSPFIQTLLDDANAAAARATLGITDATGDAINNAPALTGANLANGDKWGIYDVSASALVSMTTSEVVLGLFKTSRTISNAQFASATFKLFNAAGTPRAALFDNTAMTADRTLTLQDRDMTVGMVRLSSGTIPTTAAVDLAVPTGPRRLVLALSAYSTNGSSVPIIQLKTGGAAETSGYSGSAATLTTGTTTAGNISVGFSLLGNIAATTVLHTQIEIVLQDTNTWVASIKGALSNTAGVTLGSGSKTLAGTLDGIRLTSVGGTDIPDAGTYALYAEY